MPPQPGLSPLTRTIRVPIYSRPGHKPVSEQFIRCEEQRCELHTQELWESVLHVAAKIGAGCPGEASLRDGSILSLAFGLFTATNAALNFTTVAESN
jgi:hypothetical protein